MIERIKTELVHEKKDRTTRSFLIFVISESSSFAGFGSKARQ